MSRKISRPCISILRVFRAETFYERTSAARNLLIRAERSSGTVAIVDHRRGRGRVLSPSLSLSPPPLPRCPLPPTVNLPDAPIDNPRARVVQSTRVDARIRSIAVGARALSVAFLESSPPVI
jgi:hypothetical protein